MGGSPFSIEGDHIVGVFVCAEVSEIASLEASDWNIESPRGAFENSRWTFDSSGSFELELPLSNRIPDDNVTLIGRYNAVDAGTFAIRSAGTSTSGTSASVDGHFLVDSHLFVGTCGIASAGTVQRVLLRMHLTSRNEGAVITSPSPVSQFPVPSTYRLSLSGDVDGDRFGPLSGTIILTEPVSGDKNPLRVLVYTDTAVSGGELYADEAISSGELFVDSYHVPSRTPIVTTRITVDDETIRLEFVESHKTFILSPSWVTTASDSPPLDSLLTMIVGDGGWLTLSKDGDTVQTDIEMSGTPVPIPGIENMRQRSTFHGSGIGTPKESHSADHIPVELQETPLYLDLGEIVQTDSLGQITFGSDSGRQTLRASQYTGDFTVRTDGSRVDFSREVPDTVEREWGFLRRLGGSLAVVGLWSDGNRYNQTVPVVGRISALGDAGEVHPSYDEKHIQRDRGYDLVLQGRHREAIEPLETALELFRASREPSSALFTSELIDEVNVLTRLTYCYFLRDDFTNLLDTLEMAVDVRTILATDPDLALVQRHDGSTVQQALSGYLEQWRSMLETDVEKISLLDESQRFFIRLVELQLDLDLVEEGLVVAELARGRAFADLLASRDQVRERMSEHALGQSLPSTVTVPPVSGSDIRDAVRSWGTPVVEYFFTESDLVAWTVSKTGEISVERAPAVRKEIEAAITQFTRDIDATNSSAKSARKRRTRLHETLETLYSYLVELIDESALSLDPTEPLTIIPHGAMYRLPMGALLGPDGEPWIHEHAHTYAPSISLLPRFQRSSHDLESTMTRSNELLAFVAPEPYQRELSFTRENFTEITKFYDLSQVFDGSDAKVETLQRLGNTADVLYFGTHAEASIDDPFESYLALVTDDPDDHRFCVPEIYSLELDATLVVLAACETGLGVIASDGVLGFSRAFLWAGASSLLMTLWPVGQEQSLGQMYEFHEAWRTPSQSKAAALRQMQLAEYRAYPDQPNRWASYVLYGDWR